MFDVYDYVTMHSAAALSMNDFAMRIVTTAFC